MEKHQLMTSQGGSVLSSLEGNRPKSEITKQNPTIFPVVYLSISSTNIHRSSSKSTGKTVSPFMLLYQVVYVGCPSWRSPQRPTATTAFSPFTDGVKDGHSLTSVQNMRHQQSLRRRLHVCLNKELIISLYTGSSTTCLWQWHSPILNNKVIKQVST